MSQSPFPDTDNALEALTCWMREAEDFEAIRYPHAFTLATVDADGRPDARVVLAHRVDEHGLLFSTDDASAKARQVRACPRGAAVFYWPPLERQLRIRGTIEEASTEDADFCFDERPRKSRITAWVSRQGAPLESPDQMETAWFLGEQRFAEIEPVPRPDHWTAFRLVPYEIELWQAAAKRLHHRLAFHRAEGGRWTAQRLWP